jgi:tRNA A-37 threonylcarbamoyl transferase component Bud32
VEYDFRGELEPGRNDEKQEVIWRGDPDIYDSGKMLTLTYQRNEKELDSIENRILDTDDWDKHPILGDALDEILPSINYFFPTVTQIVLKTVEGKLTTVITEDVDEIIPYPAIPQHLSHVSTVPIAELRKLYSLGMDVDHVKWKGQRFAFKRIGESVEGTLRELTTLDKLRDSPYIIDLKAIVVNQDNLIRGFLMPYMYPGSLEDVFLMVRKKQGIAKDSDEFLIDWKLKLTWARHITQGVVDLHAIGAYNGDLKPQNVVLGPAGQAILIDFLPIGFSAEFAAPEVLAVDPHTATFESVSTGPTDIYSLGIMLYAVSQEKTRGVRPPVWRDQRTPGWYRYIVQRCLTLDPAARPSATEVLSLLQQGSS